MKKKILLVTLMVALFICILAISVSAGSLSNFINVDLTLNDGSEVEAYLAKGSTWSGYQGYSRVTIYADYTDTSKTISWSNVKVFDGRNSTIHTYDGATLTDTGAYAQTLLGYQTELSTVTHFYYPQGSLIVADNSFNVAKGWNLEYFYVPKSVKILSTAICFGNTNLTTVEIEGGSQLEEIKDSAFKDCTALSSINLQDTQLKKIHGTNGNAIDASIGTSYGNAFRGCSSLTSIQFPETLEYLGYNAFYLSGLTGKVVLPNSVTHLGPGAFLATPIETLVIGDGPVTIGFNFVGSFSDNSVSFENTYLKSVYIPSEATFEKASETWRKCTSQVTFYVIGKDCSALISSLKSSGGANHMSIGMANDENATTYGGIIVEGYNVCKAFYKNEHTISNGACTRCEEKVYCSNPEHNLEIISISYENGYDAKGKKIVKCLECNASETEVESPALFKAIGYSSPEDEDRNEMVIGYTINHDALSAYEKATGKTLSYGVFAAAQQKLGTSDIFGEGGKVAEGAITVEIKERTYSSFELKLTGFDDGNKDKKLALGAYVAVNDGEGTKYSYMQAGTPAENEKYCFVSYNSIYNTPSVDENN